ncbi:MAG: hypothetical protein EPO47_02520 [Rugosibacter sp.]|nr:MAG: hypothetical protein EPO47_02520 [Rugosibacter sp.]
MKFRLIVLVLVVASGFLSGCQTSILKPESGKTATATVEYPILFGTTHIAVTLDGKTYTGVAGELHEDIGGEQALRFGWQPKHKHYFIKQEMEFFYGDTTLSADGAETLPCDYLKHGDDWRLRCKVGDGKEISLYPVKQ